MTNIQPQALARSGNVHRHTVMDAYPGDMLDGVTGVHLYGARVLASTSPQDVVLVHSEVQSLGDVWIREHYSRCGLQVSDQIIYDESFDRVSELDLPLSSFLFGANEHAVRPNQLFADQAERMNNKNEFIRFCREQGAPTPKTDLFASVLEVEGFEPEFPVYVKGAVSASGEHVFRCEDSEEYHKALGQISGEFQVQEALPEDTIFCNIQYSSLLYNGTRNHKHGPLTRQQLSGNAHNGNVFPSGVDPDIVQPITDKLSTALFHQGLDGTWAFDVAVCGKQAYLIECNPRWNGASYFSKPAELLNAKEWEGVNVTTSHNSFAFFGDSFRELEYDPVHGTGIVIINWATVLHGKLGLLVVGDLETRERLLSEFKNRFCR